MGVATLVHTNIERIDAPCWHTHRFVIVGQPDSLSAPEVAVVCGLHFELKGDEGISQNSQGFQHGLFRDPRFVKNSLSLDVHVNPRRLDRIVQVQAKINLVDKDVD